MVITHNISAMNANLDNTAENTQAAESRIRDTDVAEMVVGKFQG